MFFNALGYFAFIILSGLALITCLILFIIRISQNHKQMWNWLAGAVVAVLLLLLSVYLFTRKVIHTVKQIGNSVEQTIVTSVEEIKKQDSSYKYKMLDQNEMVKKLKEFERLNGSNGPDEFYVYYGYLDYYRMPLAYPYSIHCTDILETGSLFNEEKVTEFNVNDNGEVNCDVENINAFAFDNNVLIAGKGTSSKNSEWLIYEFSTGKKTECTALMEAIKIARKEYHYRGYDTLITIQQYQCLFN